MSFYFVRFIWQANAVDTCSMRSRGATWRILGVAIVACLVSAGCASDSPDQPAGDPGQVLPRRAVLTCSADGTVTLSTDTVQPRPDGVHLRVMNGFDEPVSVEGFDVGPGKSDWVIPAGPGTMKLACYPFSQHTSGVKPTRYPLEIVDPAGLYIDGAVACEFNGSTIVENFKEFDDLGPPPMDIARELITGLRQDDVLRVAGYPEQDHSTVIVIRDDEVVANYSIRRFEGDPWQITAASVCPDTGLAHEGENFS